jgi:uncharacterized protein YjbJ (UPF0337 family)
MFRSYNQLVGGGSPFTAGRNVHCSERGHDRRLFGRPHNEEHDMNRDEIKGKVEQVQGKVKEQIGRATSDERLRDEGVADQAEGEVREGYGKVKRNIGEAIEDIGENIKR